MDRNSIKLRIREILALKGMTNRALADKIQVSPQYVSNILNGSALSLNALCKIADALEVEFGDLFVSSFTPDSPFENEFGAQLLPMVAVVCDNSQEQRSFWCLR